MDHLSDLRLKEVTSENTTTGHYNKLTLPEGIDLKEHIAEATVKKILYYHFNDDDEPSENEYSWTYEFALSLENGLWIYLTQNVYGEKWKSLRFTIAITKSYEELIKQFPLITKSKYRNDYSHLMCKHCGKSLN